MFRMTGLTIKIVHFISDAPKKKMIEKQNYSIHLGKNWNQK